MLGRRALPVFLAAVAIFGQSSSLLAQSADCILEQSITTDAVISDTLDQQISEFAELGVDSFFNAPILGAIHDFNNNGTRDYLSAEGAALNQIYIRDGLTGNRIWGPFNTGAGAIPNQLASIGDINGDGKPEFAIGVRRTSNVTNQDGVWVFNGATGQEIASFPSVLAGHVPKGDNDMPSEITGSTRVYPHNANKSGMSAAVAETPVGKKIVFFDANAYNGMGIFTHVCSRQLLLFWTDYNCYIETEIFNDANGMQNRDFGGQLVNLRNLNNPSAAPELFVSDPSMTWAVDVGQGTPPDLSWSGGVYKYYPAENAHISDLPPRASHIRMGFWMTNVGDIDGDGWQDLLVGSPAGSVDNLNGGQVDIYRGGQSANPVYKNLIYGAGSAGALFGFSAHGGTDLNADGVKDIVVGAPYAEGSGRVLVFSSDPQDSKVKYRIASPLPGSRFGHSVVALGPDRIAVADGAGKIQIIKLGADVSGASDGGPNKIPDRCEVAPPTPTPPSGRTAQQQATIDDVYLRLAKNMTAQLNALFKRLGHNRVMTLCNGLVAKATQNQTIVTANQALFASVHSGLTPAAFNNVLQKVVAVKNAYASNKPAKTIRQRSTQLRVSMANVIQILTPAVTQSLRVK